MPLPRIATGILSIALTLVVAAATQAQDFPSKPIRIFTTTPGGFSDFASRIIAQGISGPLGQSVVIENRAGGSLAAEPVDKAPPDGHTIFVGGAAFWILPLLQKTPYEPANFTPITLISKEVFLVVVHPSVPVKTIKELVALAKARPGELNYGSGAAGGPNHIAMELLKSMTGVNIVNVPYKGPPAAVTAQIAGEVQVSLSDISIVAPHMKSGRLRALAVTSAEPSALFPSMPTVASSVPGYEWVGMTVTLMHAKTARPIVNRLNQEIVRVLKSPEVREKFLASGAEVVGNSPEEFAALIKSDTARISKVIKDAGIKVN
jgi:tripartite-type tricarboxylate transporter receptor subunit TctC